MAGAVSKHHVLHYWRALIPVLAEQLTGAPYIGRIRAGCQHRTSEYGVVTVTYVTPAEYRKETGRAWPVGSGAKAYVGSTYGRIWFAYAPRVHR